MQQLADQALTMWDELVSSVILSNLAITLVGILEATQEEEIKIEFFYERLFLYPFKRKINSALFVTKDKQINYSSSNIFWYNLATILDIMWHIQWQLLGKKVKKYQRKIINGVKSFIELS